MAVRNEIRCYGIECARSGRIDEGCQFEASHENTLSYSRKKTQSAQCVAWRKSLQRALCIIPEDMASISCACRSGEGAKKPETREEDKALDAEGVAGSFLFGLHFHHDLSLAHPALDTSGPLSVCALPNSYGIFLVLWQHIVQESYTYDIDLGCYHRLPRDVYLLT